MFFSNFRALRIKIKTPFNLDRLIAMLTTGAMPPTLSADAQPSGWVPPRADGPLAESVGKQFLIALGVEKKLLPTSVINQFAKVRAQELEEQQGFKVGRKKMKEIQEHVKDQLLPRAFTIESKTTVWIDTLNGWLVINSSVPSKHDDVIKLVLKSIPDLALESFNVKQSPQSAMTQWLQEGDAPPGFTIDSNSELRATGESKATVRYMQQTLETDDVRRHIEAGKQCTNLALTWNDKISFVLTEDLTIKKIKPLDILKESKEVLNDDERFDADFTLMSGELNNLLQDLTESLGGFAEEQKSA